MLHIGGINYPFSFEELENKTKSTYLALLSLHKEDLNAKHASLLSITSDNEAGLKSAILDLPGVFRASCACCALNLALKDLTNLNSLIALLADISAAGYNVNSWSLTRWLSLDDVFSNPLTQDATIFVKYPALHPYFIRARAISNAIQMLEGDNVTLMEAAWVIYSLLANLWKNNMHDLYGAIMWIYFIQISPNHLYETVIFVPPPLFNIPHIFVDTHSKINPHFNEDRMRYLFCKLAVNSNTMTVAKANAVFTDYSPKRFANYKHHPNVKYETIGHALGASRRFVEDIKRDSELASRFAAFYPSLLTLKPSQAPWVRFLSQLSNRIRKYGKLQGLSFNIALQKLAHAEPIKKYTYNASYLPPLIHIDLSRLLLQRTKHTTFFLVSNKLLRNLEPEQNNKK